MMELCWELIKTKVIKNQNCTLYLENRILFVEILSEKGENVAHAKLSEVTHTNCMPLSPK